MPVSTRRSPAGDEPYSRFQPKSRAAWRAWLQKNHAKAPGVVLVYAKKHTGLSSLDWDEAVEEALCFGWIDSRRWRLDEQFFLQIFTPRRPKSAWSALNKKRVERLIAEGLMTPAGQKEIDLAKETGAWTARDHIEALVMPADFLTALAKSAKARAGFEASSPFTHKMCLYRLHAAKRPETRERYITQLVDAFKTGKNPFRMQTKKASS
jgi:uncharacterized protein YdeI (YjbR/CyaY-like superfamily)